GSAPSFPGRSTSTLRADDDFVTEVSAPAPRRTKPGHRDGGGGMAETRIGLVGAGGVAQRHARVLSALPEVQVMGVTDVQPAAAAALAEAYGATVFNDVDDLLGAGPDAGYVWVPRLR